MLYMICGDQYVTHGRKDGMQLIFQYTTSAFGVANLQTMDCNNLVNYICLVCSLMGRSYFVLAFYDQPHSSNATNIIYFWCSKSTVFKFKTVSHDMIHGSNFQMIIVKELYFIHDIISVDAPIDDCSKHISPDDALEIKHRLLRQYPNESCRQQW